MNQAAPHNEITPHSGGAARPGQPGRGPAIFPWPLVASVMVTIFIVTLVAIVARGVVKMLEALP